MFIPLDNHDLKGWQIYDENGNVDMKIPLGLIVMYVSMYVFYSASVYNV